MFNVHFSYTTIDYSKEDRFEESKMGSKVIARVEARDDKNLKQNSRNQKEKDGTD